MATISQQLFIANFRGIPFLVESSEKTAGRKTVIHEYPNKKFRYIEDLGQNLRTFNVTAIISDPLYLIKRIALEHALDQEGTGILIHPFYGMASVVCTSYTITEEQKNLGKCSIAITFEEAYDNIYPVSSGDTNSTIQQLLDELLPYIDAYVATEFINFFKHNTPDAAEKLDTFNDTMNAPKSPSSNEDYATSIFSAQSTELNANKYNLINNPTALGQTITSIITAYNDLGKTAQDSYTLNNVLANYGYDDIYIEPTTAELQERVKNRLVLNNAIRAMALINLYKNALLIEYKDDLQLLKVSENLEDKYQALIYNQLSDDITEKLQNIRTKVKNFLNALNININKVITINIKRVPLTVLLFQYYDNFDNENEILALNDIYDPSILDGQLNILTNG